MQYLAHYKFFNGFKLSKEVDCSFFFYFRCNTDIELGVRCGFQTLLVLSGVTSTKDIEKIRNEKKPPLPDVVLPKLGDIISLVPS